MQRFNRAHNYTIDVRTFLLYFIVLLPGVENPLYQLTLLEELRVQHKHSMKRNENMKN